MLSETRSHIILQNRKESFGALDDVKEESFCTIFANDQAFFRVICCSSVILKLSAIRLQLGTSEFFLINATKADLIYSLTCNINSNNLSMHEDFQRFRGNFFFVIFSVHYK